MNDKTSLDELRRKAKLPVTQAGGSTVAAFFEQNKHVLQALLPKHVSAGRVLRIGLSALRLTPKLKECTSESLFGAIVSCAQLGLEPNTPMGHAYMVPFRNNQANRMDVQVIFGYRGLIDLARRSGNIESIAAHAVFENDEFKFEYGLNEQLMHRPASDDRGEITHFYAVAKFKGGGHAFEVMSRHQVEDIRDNSQNYKFARDKSKTVWGQHFEEMGRKTAIRRLYKYLPTSIEMAAASAGDGSVVSNLPDSDTAALDGALEGEFERVDDAGQADDGADMTDSGPVTDSAGVKFDPEKHIAPDRRNTDGTFTKRPTRRGKSDKGGAKGDPIKPYVDAMRAVKTLDELNEAREKANTPGAGLSEDQIKALDGFYEGFVNRLRNQGGNGGNAEPAGQEPPPGDDDDPGFGDIE